MSILIKDVDVDGRATHLYIEGDRIAEIAFFQKVGDVVGMTMASEATLACELGIPYASLCTVDNFAHGIVDELLTFEAIRNTQHENAALTRTVVAKALGLLR